MKLSIVTPSFNQASYLEPCVHSVLAQRVPDLEYIVMDGGSTDGSADILRRHADRLAYWQSTPDRGQMDAVQAGLLRSTGEIMGWLNSDDMYTPWALQVVEDVFTALPQVEWLTTLVPLVMDARGMVISARHAEGYSARAFYRGRNTRSQAGFHTFVIQQESTFWRRSLWEKAGARCDLTQRMTGDFELWSRFFRHAELYGVAVPLGCFRVQPGSFTSNEAREYQRACEAVLDRYGSWRVPSAEIALRRVLRRLPKRMYPLTGLAYPAPVLRQEGRGSEWKIQRTWIL